MTKTLHVSPDDNVGDVLLLGLFGGAICNHWRIASKSDGVATLVRVEPVSSRNEDGTFSSHWVPA